MKMAVMVMGMAASACGDASNAVYADLEQTLLESEVIFHFGCVEWPEREMTPDPDLFDIRCGDGRWRCGEAALETLGNLDDDERDGVVISWLSPPTIVGRFFHAYHVHADGSATHFWEEKTDVADSDCGSYCGWHRENVVDFFAQDGSPRLVPSGNPVTDYAACEWP